MGETSLMEKIVFVETGVLILDFLSEFKWLNKYCKMVVVENECNCNVF